MLMQVSCVVGNVTVTAERAGGFLIVTAESPVLLSTNGAPAIRGREVRWLDDGRAWEITAERGKESCTIVLPAL